MINSYINTYNARTKGFGSVSSEKNKQANDFMKEVGLKFVYTKNIYATDEDNRVRIGIQKKGMLPITSGKNSHITSNITLTNGENQICEYAYGSNKHEAKENLINKWNGEVNYCHTTVDSRKFNFTA